MFIKILHVLLSHIWSIILSIIIGYHCPHDCYIMVTKDPHILTLLMFFMIYEDIYGWLFIGNVLNNHCFIIIAPPWLLQYLMAILDLHIPPFFFTKFWVNSYRFLDITR